MVPEISARRWIQRFKEGGYNNPNWGVQIAAGWYDWFCDNSSLRNKTYKMGKIIAKIHNGGKIDLDKNYVWFKNNCPLYGPLYDDFRFASLEDREVQFTIQIDCCCNKKKYAVYGRRHKGGEFSEKPLFECSDSRILVKWFNTPWEE